MAWFKPKVVYVLSPEVAVVVVVEVRGGYMWMNSWS